MQEFVLPISVAGFTSRLKGLGTQLGLYLMPDSCSPWFYLNTVLFVGGIRGEEELSVLPDIVFCYPARREECSREMASRRGPAKGIVLRLSKAVPEGREFLVDYPLGDILRPVERGAEERGESG